METIIYVYTSICRSDCVCIRMHLYGIRKSAYIYIYTHREREREREREKEKEKEEQEEKEGEKEKEKETEKATPGTLFGCPWGAPNLTFGSSWAPF